MAPGGALKSKTIKITSSIRSCNSMKGKGILKEDKRLAYTKIKERYFIKLALCVKILLLTLLTLRIEAKIVY